MTIVRDPTEDDIASATRGLNLMRLTDAELVRLYTRHGQINLFASRVIAAAARIVWSERNVTAPRY